jgi:hypothetical protein
MFQGTPEDLRAEAYTSGLPGLVSVEQPFSPPVYDKNN